MVFYLATIADNESNNLTSNTMQPAISIHNQPFELPVLRVASPAPENRTSNLPVLFSERQHAGPVMGLGVGVEATASRQATAESMAQPEGRNARRLRLIFEQEHDKADVFELFGWSDLPTTLRSAIRTDLEAYRDELLGLYSSCNAAVHERRKRVSWWVYAYRNSLCTAETALSMLSIEA